MSCYTCTTVMQQSLGGVYVAMGTRKSALSLHPPVVGALIAFSSLCLLIQKRRHGMGAQIGVLGLEMVCEREKRRKLMQSGGFKDRLQTGLLYQGERPVCSR